MRSKQDRQVFPLRSPEDESWTAAERASLHQLQMFNVRQPLALLLASFDQFSEGDRASFARLLRAVTVVALRYNVICSRQSNEQEAVYNHIAVAISERRINGAGVAIGDLRSVYPDDAAFRAAFADKSLRTTSSRNKQVARFILFQLERKLSGSSFDFESARYHIEHVLSERPGDDWDQFDEQQRAACTYRLGNLTLLGANSNRDAGNAGFAEKRAAYHDSEFASTRKLAEDYDTWNVDKIRARQAWMARPATSIWRIEF